MSGDRMPWFPLYPTDLLNDLALSSVSIAAQGLWFRLLCQMHLSPRRGYLEDASGKPLSDKTLAKVAGISQQTLRKLVKELELCCVFSRTNLGVIYSRRMVRDEDKRIKAKEYGKKGGNPNITQRVNPPHNLLPPGISESESETESKNPPPPSSSSDGGEEDGWIDLAVRLKTFGVKSVNSAIRKAKAESYRPDQIAAWVDELDTPKFRGKVGPGAIVVRIEHQDGKGDWDWLLNEKRGGRPEPVSLYPAAGTLSERETAELARLEVAYGKQLDDMTDAQVRSHLPPSRDPVSNVSSYRRLPRRRLVLLWSIESAATLPQSHASGEPP